MSRRSGSISSIYSDPPQFPPNPAAQRLARPPKVRLMCLHKLKMRYEVLLSSANRDLIWSYLEVRNRQAPQSRLYVQAVCCTLPCQHRVSVYPVQLGRFQVDKSGYSASERCDHGMMTMVRCYF